MNMSTMMIQKDEDRLSALPDEIVHEILWRIRSPKQAARVIVLSKRWNLLWRSYPILEFDYREWQDKQMGDIFAAAVANKFLQLEATTAKLVLSHPYNNYELSSSENILWPAKEIDIKEEYTGSSLGRSVIQRLLLLLGLEPPPASTNRFRRLEVLKLQGRFDYPYRWAYKIVGNINPFACFASSLRVLCLSNVRFPDDTILNSMIAGAPRLECLRLSRIDGIPNFHIRNHQNLKTLDVAGFFDHCSFDIAGVPSLETLHVPNLQVSLSPNNVKSLYMTRLSQVIRSEDLTKFISKFSSLESLKLHDSSHRVLKVQIFGHPKLQEVEIDYHDGSPTKVIEIGDAPMLTSFVFNGHSSRFPAILLSSYVPVSVNCKLLRLIDFHELKQFLAKLSQHPLTFTFFTDPYEVERPIKVKDKSPIPVIERANLLLNFFNYWDKIHVFLNNFFQTCHPKLLSFTGTTYSVPENSSFIHPEDICMKIMEGIFQNSEITGRECWVHQLKDVKMVMKNVGGIRKDQDQGNISTYNWPSSLAELEQTSFILDWY